MSDKFLKIYQLYWTVLRFHLPTNIIKFFLRLWKINNDCYYQLFLGLQSTNYVIKVVYFTQQYLYVEIPAYLQVCWKVWELGGQDWYFLLSRSRKSDRVLLDFPEYVSKIMKFRNLFYKTFLLLHSMPILFCQKI